MLDVGNSRTCGILIETIRTSRSTSTTATCSRCATCRGRSGSTPSHSRAGSSSRRPVSARSTLPAARGAARAFFWPSLVRVGPEAVRLGGRGRGHRGHDAACRARSATSGRPSRSTRNGASRSGDYTSAGEDPPIARAARRFLTETGDVIRQLEAEETAGAPAPAQRQQAGAIRSKFSRSSLYGFMLAEIWSRRSCQINDPGVRAGPRRGRAAAAAADHHHAAAGDAASPSSASCARAPRARSSWSGTCWAGPASRRRLGRAARRHPLGRGELRASRLAVHRDHPEVLGPARREFLRLVGKERPFVDRAGRSRRRRPRRRAEPADRQHRHRRRHHGPDDHDLLLEDNRAILPTQNFREGFKIAGDDILRGGDRAVVLPAFAAAAARVPARERPRAAAGTVRWRPDQHGGAAKAASRRLFVLRVLIPIGARRAARGRGGRGAVDAPARILSCRRVLRRRARGGRRAPGGRSGRRAGRGLSGGCRAPRRRPRLPADRHELSRSMPAQIEQVVRSVMRQVIGLLCGGDQCARLRHRAGHRPAVAPADDRRHAGGAVAGDARSR